MAGEREEEPMFSNPAINRLWFAGWLGLLLTALIAFGVIIVYAMIYGFIRFVLPHLSELEIAGWRWDLIGGGVLVWLTMSAFAYFKLLND